MSELDGEWELRRLSGALPPLAGMRKRILGDRGRTILPGGVGVPFRVVGRELRYLPPFQMVVDALEPDAEGYVGRTRVLGREIGRFRLTRRAT